MTLPDIINQNSHIKSINQRLQLRIIALLILAEVHSEDLHVDIRARILGLYFGGERLEFRGSARDEQQVEAFLRELDGVFFSEAVGGAGYYCPGALLAVFAELEGRLAVYSSIVFVG